MKKKKTDDEKEDYYDEKGCKAENKHQRGMCSAFPRWKDRTAMQ